MKVLLALAVVFLGLPLSAIQANEAKPTLERTHDLSHHRHHHHHHRHHHHWRSWHHRHHHHHHHYRY